MPLYHPFLSFTKAVRLPNYGYVGLTRLEREIIDTEFVQRLRYIQQTPGAHYVYPGSSHKRFEHSLGVMQLAGQASFNLLLNDLFVELKKDEKIKRFYSIETMEEFCPVLLLLQLMNKKVEKKIREKYKKEMKKIAHHIQLARIVGLLHDIGHGPFSHTFELFHEMAKQSGLMEADFDHETYGKKMLCDKMVEVKNIKKALDKNGFDIYEVLSSYCDLKKGNLTKDEEQLCKSLGIDLEKITDVLVENPFLNRIIKGPYNVDRLDYLVLDAKRTGTVEYGIMDVARLLMYLRMDDYEKELCMGTKAIDTTIRFIEAYKHMYTSVYLHRVARGVDLHIAQMLLYVYQEAQKYSGKTILSEILNPTINTLLSLTDGGVLFEIRKVVKSSPSSFKETSNFARGFFRRDTLRLASECGPDQIVMKHKNLFDFEKEIKSKSGAPYVFLDVLTTLPAPAPNVEDLLFEPESVGKPPRSLSQVVDPSIAIALTTEVKSVRVYTFKKYRKSVKEAFEKLI